MSGVADGNVTPDFIFRVLEELKNQGASQVIMHYGEGFGVDDTGLEPGERNIQLSWLPYGAINDGDIRIVWQGKLSSLATYDFTQVPEILTLSERRDLVSDRPGFFMFGEFDVMDFYRTQGTLDYRKWKSK